MFHLQKYGHSKHVLLLAQHHKGQQNYMLNEFNTLQTGDADLRLYITTVQDG
jgi:hypothetical protein